MFNFFKKNDKKAKISAAIDGDIIPITAVKDDVFSTKMLGDGYAIKPSNGLVFAPVSGEVTTLFPTKHAIGIATNNGLELLIHLGIDTVELKGAPFDVMVKKGEKVIKDKLIAKMNLQEITDKKYDDIVIVVYTNMDILKSVSQITPQKVKQGTTVQTIEYK